MSDCDELFPTKRVYWIAVKEQQLALVCAWCKVGIPHPIRDPTPTASFQPKAPGIELDTYLKLKI